MLLALLLPLCAAAQQPMDPPEIPPPLPNPDKRGEEERLPADERIAPERDEPWGLPDDLLAELAERSKLYAEYAVRFTCDETARLAGYDGSGQAASEKIRRYAYLLVREGGQVREFRNRLDKRGNPKPAETEDEETFPPAYAWAFLFAKRNQPYFAYRDLGDRFEGFDWVREIQFKGALSFTDGRDIRQWEGTILVDASTLTPLEVWAQPAHQDDRIRSQFDRWAKSFNLIGFRLAPKPIAYKSHVRFRYRRDGLTFPTEMRYDTLRATSPTRSVPVRASIREYENYRFFKPEAGQEEFESEPTD